MSLCGFMPDLRGCFICGKDECERFNITQGALQCASCPSSGDIRMPISEGTLAAMRYITYCDAKKLFSFSLSEFALEQLAGIAESYLLTRLERGFSTLDLYKSLLYLR